MSEQLEGRALDRAIAEARGWKRYVHDGKTWVETEGNGMWSDGTMWESLPDYTSPEWTVRLLEEMRAGEGIGGVYPQVRGWRVAVLDDVRGEGSYASCYAPTLGLAVARAWLAWAQAKAPAGEAGASDGGGVRQG